MLVLAQLTGWGRRARVTSQVATSAPRAARSATPRAAARCGPFQDLPSPIWAFLEDGRSAVLINSRDRAHAFVAAFQPMHPQRCQPAQSAAPGIDHDNPTIDKVGYIAGRKLRSP
jgi:hypothetical protein